MQEDFRRVWVSELKMVEDCSGEEHVISFGMVCKKDLKDICISLKVV